MLCAPRSKSVISAIKRWSLSTKMTSTARSTQRTVQTAPRRNSKSASVTLNESASLLSMRRTLIAAGTQRTSRVVDQAAVEALVTQATTAIIAQLSTVILVAAIIPETVVTPVVRVVIVLVLVVRATMIALGRIVRIILVAITTTSSGLTFSTSRRRG